jgi:hypothetical protein
MKIRSLHGAHHVDFPTAQLSTWASPATVVLRALKSLQEKFSQRRTHPRQIRQLADLMKAVGFIRSCCRQEAEEAGSAR